MSKKHTPRLIRTKEFIHGPSWPLHAPILAAARTNAMSLRDLASVTGRSASYLSKVERGLSVPDINLLRTLCVKLDINPTRFGFKKESKP